MKMNQQSGARKPRDTPVVTLLMILAFLVGAPPTLFLLFTQWGDSMQRQAAVGIGMVALTTLIVLRNKYMMLFTAFIMFSQFKISLVSIPLADPVKLQFLFVDVVLVIIIAAAIERKEALWPDKVGWALILLVVWEAISASIFSAHFDRSVVFVLWQLKYLLLYLLVRNLEIDESFAGKVRVTIMAVIAVQALIAVGQYFRGGTLGLLVFGEQDPSRLFFVKEGLRVSGTLGATNAFGGYMSMMLVAALPFLFRYGGGAAPVAFGLGSIALLLSLSRAGWLSFLIGASSVLLALMRARVVNFGRAALVVIAANMLVAGVVAYNFDKVRERFENRDAVASAQGRFYQFYQTWPVIERYPVFGIGPGVTEFFGAWNDDAKYVSRAIPDVRLGNQPHSSQLQYWVESGTPGFLLFMTIFFMTIATGLSRPAVLPEAPQSTLMRIGAAGAAISVMVSASLGPEIGNVQISSMFWIFLALARNDRNKHRHESAPQRGQRRLSKKAIG
jgi:hypothetical protein